MARSILVKKLAVTLTGSVWLAFSGSAEWIATSSPARYLEPDNWSNGVVDDRFSTLATTTTVTLDADRAMSSSGLVVDYPEAYSLTFNGVDGPRKMSFSGGELFVDISGSTTKGVQFGAQNGTTTRIDLDFGTAPAVVRLSPNSSTGADNLTIFGSVLGTGFQLFGSGTFKLYGEIATGGGVAEFLGGTSYLYSWGVSGSHGITGSSGVRLSGTGTRLSMQSKLSNVGLEIQGAAFQSSGGTENIDLSLGNGRAMIINRGSGAIKSATFVRSSGSVLTVGADTIAAIGDTRRVIFGDGQGVLADLVGGIVPWAGAQAFSADEKFTDSNNFDPSLPVSYDAEKGFVPLNESGMCADISTATATDNVKVASGITFEKDISCNSLTFTAWQPNFDLNGHTLTLKSGLVLHRNNKPVIKGGTIALDGHPLILMGRQDSSISSRITSTNTDPAEPVLIISSGAGNCSLYGDNTGLVGTVYVAAGGLTPSGNALTTSTAVELATGTSFPVGWSVSAQAGAVGGLGTLKFGDGKTKLQLGVPSGTVSQGTIVVGNGGRIAPGEKDASGVRRGSLDIGANVSSVLMQSGSVLEIALASLTESTMLDAKAARVVLGGELSLKGETDGKTAEWIIVRTNPTSTEEPRITGSFATVPKGYAVELQAIDGSTGVNAVVLKRKANGMVVFFL